MKVTVSKIPEGGTNLQFARDGAWFRSRLLPGDPLAPEVETVEIACTIRRDGETVFIEGGARTVVGLSCSRCLETTHLALCPSFRYTYLPAAPLCEEEVELRTDDLEFAYYSEDTIDLDELIFEQIMLQIPIKPLCAETCRGLCPHCGTNLNMASCGCRRESFDERLAVLKDFKILPKDNQT